VPRLYSAYAARSQFHLIQEYLPGGDLLAALQARRGRGFEEAVVAEQVRLVGWLVGWLGGWLVGWLGLVG